MELIKYKLGEIAEIRGRIGFRGYTVNDLVQKHEGAITFSPTNISDHTISYNDCDYISFEKYEESPEIQIFDGDILFTKTGSTFGKCAYIEGLKEKATINPQFIVFKNIKCNPKYLYYVIRSEWFQNNIKHIVTGSTIPTMSQENLKEIEVFLPSIEEQLRIANVLSALDRKIALNRAINQNLEALAKQLYDYWFVQFDFPNEEGKPYKSSDGKMVWNDKLKREIPEGWNNGTVGDLFATQAGYAFKSSEWKECGHPVLTIKNIQEDGSVTFSDASFIDKYDCKLDKYSSNNGNMIFAMSGNTIGKIGIISSNIPNVLINQRVLIIKTNVKNIAFPYFVIKDKKIQNLVLQLGANSAQPNISEEEFRNIKICIPPKSIMDDFNQMFKDSFEKIINNRIEIDVLTKQRDELLPLLMNGQVTIE